MSELIRVKNTSYARYEELLLRRENVKKEAFAYQQGYIREFGELILQLFQIKMECIQKKKAIAYCQKALNYGNQIDQNELCLYLETEMAKFHAQFQGMLEEHENAKNATKLTEYEMLQIKRIYRRLIKKIHPDINPLVEQSDVLSDLWNRVVVAYNCNHLKELEELEVLVAGVLAAVAGGGMDIEIPDIDQKMAEIEAEIKKIMDTDPYQYKYILEDAGLIEEKKTELQADIKDYREYAEELDALMSGLTDITDSTNGGALPWQMN